MFRERLSLMILLLKHSKTFFTAENSADYHERKVINNILYSKYIMSEK